jgi:hypothetical protein
LYVYFSAKIVFFDEKLLTLQRKCEKYDEETIVVAPKCGGKLP